MGQHLNRLDKKDALKWDTAYGQFCKTGVWNLRDGQMAKITKVYLVQKVIGKRLEIIAIKTNWEIAWGLIRKDEIGIVTEMFVDKDYPEGVGICDHWHCDPNEKDADGKRLG